jgi:hypothetical protein
MSGPRLTAVVCTLAYLTASPGAFAQTAGAGSSPTAVTPIVVEADLRIGNWWPILADQTLPTVGGRVAIYPSRRSAARRLSLQLIGDYRQLSRTEDYDFDLDSGYAFTQHLFNVMPSVGVDLVRTRLVAVDVRAGLAIIGRRSTFALERGGRFDDDDYENVCRFQAFRDYCDSNYDTSGVMGAGLRVSPFGSRSIYLGVDYTRLFGPDDNVLVGSVGLRVD